jgi:AAA+ superfamily predicted ATPase
MMKAKIGLMAIETHEETRAIALIEEIARDPKVSRSVYQWTITNGVKELPLKPNDPPANPDPMGALMEIESAKTNGVGKIYILLDFNKYLEEPAILRKVRDLSSSLKNTRKSIIFISPSFPIPGDLSKSMAIFDLPLPSRIEIEARIESVIKGVPDQIAYYRDQITDHPAQKDQYLPGLTDLVNFEKVLNVQWRDNKSAIIDACTGLTDEEIENIISRSLIKRDLNVSVILSEKKQIIRKSGSLEYFETSENMSTIGGMVNAKRYARRASKMFSKEAQNFGVVQPRGILLIGAPGTGKSLFAKAISNEMNQPLLKLDMASQKSKWYGESGQTLIKSLKVAHAISPAILWIDEIDKAVSRSGDQSMHEESASMLGTLLTDMEERPGLFFLATCNQPFGLPPELLSRFQKVFYVDLPNEKERSEIFEIQIRAVKRDPKNYDIARLSQNSAGYSGREIRNIVQESLSIAFDEGTELSTEIILNQITRITPISVQKKQEIDRMREWSAKNAELANEKPAEPAPVFAGISRKLELY